MAKSTERVLANEVIVGDVIVCPNGDSITVESMSRDGDLIDFTGKQTRHSAFGDESRGIGMYNQFWDELVTVISRSGK
jgi:hypothetical protein